MALTLTYRGRTSLPVELEGLLPAMLRASAPSDIERLPIVCGNRTTALAELFDVAGRADDERVVFIGELAGVHGIGARLDRGTIRIEGSAGRHVGAGMRGGEIHVAGDVGDWAGAEMRGGTLRVDGSAANHAGAAYSGSPRGMSGGMLLIGGRAGCEVGHSMRRGTIAVGGDVGDAAALNMIAGTILVFGSTGRRSAAGMRRGTLFVGGARPHLLPTFRSTGVCRTHFLMLYYEALRRRGFAVPPTLGTTLEMFSGDLLGGGKGEVLVAA